MSTEDKQILEELKAIRSGLDFIKDNMPDKDMFLSVKEKLLLEESHRNEKAGKLVSSKDLRKQIGI